MNYFTAFLMLFAVFVVARFRKTHPVDILILNAIQDIQMIVAVSELLL